MKKTYTISRRKFLELFTGSCCGLLTSCSTVPITERKQLTIYPESFINKQAAGAYMNFKKKAKLIKDGKDLKNIIEFSMTGTIKIDKEDFDMDSIPDECIIKDLNNDENESNPHPNLKLLAKQRDYVYKEKSYPHRLNFGKRIPVGGEIIDIRKPLNTIICTYSRQPRFFVPQQNKNGYYLRCLLPDELKQIQGFPKDFKISGNKNKQIIQIGNAVPPPLAEKVVKKLLKIYTEA